VPKLALLLVASHVHRCAAAPGGAATADAAAVARFAAHWREHAAAPLAGRNAIVGSICHQLSGMFDVKLALLLTLIGGVRHEHAAGVRTRGEAHLLLVGDPGTGKSVVMKYAARIASR